MPATVPGQELQRLHASAVALDGAGVLILGASGAGKSALALRLIALGADLVADDQVEIFSSGGHPHMRPPTRLAGLIEARHLGILRLPFRAPARIALILRLGPDLPPRLPGPQQETLMDAQLPLLHGSRIDFLAPAIICCLKGELISG